MSKSTFFTGQPVFTQLLNFIPKTLVQQISRKHSGDRYCKKFKAYDHLVCMLYAGFFQCTSLRELITGMQANAGRLNHLGLVHTPRRSTLSDANGRRMADFFGDLYHHLYKRYFGLPDSRLGAGAKESRLFIIDSTTISLFSSIMHGAGGYGTDGKKKGGAKAHMMIDARHDIPAFITITEAREHDLVFLRKVHVPDQATVVFDKAYINHRQFKDWNQRSVTWVSRLKAKSVIKYIEEYPLSREQADQGVLRDRLALLGRYSNRRKSPQVQARIIEYYDKEKNRSFCFITNDTTCEPFHTACLYKQRWQIEMLFKRIKQRYPLKYFLGDNPNAIKIQIWCALICDLLVKIIQTQINKTGKRLWAYASLASMIKHHLMTYINMRIFLLNPEKAILHYHPPNHQLVLF